MGLRDDLLARGWFPRELPPPFRTATFAAAAQRGAVPAEFGQTKPELRLASHNLPRYAGHRRTVALANPLAQYGLCREIETAWTELLTTCSLSPYSVSSPIVLSAGRAVERRIGREELPARRVLNRVGARWLLRTDVARCYPSMYTHSIAWALHGKPLAKVDRSSALAGNRLDSWTRKAQFGQTMGIPIGPDTSLILSELILSAVDAGLARRRPGIRAMRYMDDYECAASSHSEAMDIMCDLQEELHEYELALSHEKTSVVQLPHELQRPWATAQRRVTVRTDTAYETADLIGYFDTAFSDVRRFPQEPVLNFALAHLKTLPPPVRPKSRELLQALLLQAMVLEPGTHRYVISYFTETPENRPLDPDQVCEVLSDQVVFHARLRHTSEVAWALWASITLGVPLKRDAARVLGSVDDDVVALLALHARESGLLPELNVDMWMQYMTRSELRGEHWLLAYEANVKGWLPPVGGVDHVAADPAFGWMKAGAVSFYDAGAPHLMPAEMLEPEAAWEDANSGP